MVHIIDDDSLSICNISAASSDVVFPSDMVPRISLNISNCDGVATRPYLFSVFATRESDDKSYHMKFNVSDFLESEAIPLYLAPLRRRGVYNIRVYELTKGGIVGTYYSDLMMSSNEKRMERIDEAINLAWSQEIGSSMRWRGFVQHPGTACCAFQVEGENVRLWIDGFLVIETPPFFGVHNHSGSELFEIILEIRQFRSSSSHIRLLWNATGEMEVIDSHFLYFQVCYNRTCLTAIYATNKKDLGTHTFIPKKSEVTQHPLTITIQ